MDGLVKGLVWVGSRTEHYAQMVGFYRDVLRLPLEREEGEFAVFMLPDEVPSLLLYGHVDVVPVEGQNWQHPPLEGKNVDG